MKSDTSRDTFRPEKHYHGVRLQQGRVQLDADWNELVDILTYLLTTTARDAIGSSAVVISGANAALTPTTGGFAIGIAAGGADLTIASGRAYVEGVLCESSAPAAPAAYTYRNQPDLPGLPLPDTSSTYIVYLDVWDRPVGVVEDPALREVALGGVDTTTRTQTVAQVKLIAVANNTTCTGSAPAYDAVTAPSTGQLSARVQQAAAATTPCDVSGGGGFGGLENQLYRVEVHKPGTIAGGAGADRPTFKWSRDNGSVVAAVIALVSDGSAPTANVLVLQNEPPDDARGFAIGQWLEVTDDIDDLHGVPGLFVQLIDVQGTRLRFDAANVRRPDGTVTSDPLPIFREEPPGVVRDHTRHPKVRRWDGSDTTGVVSASVPATNGGYIALEGGIEIRFSDDGTYRTGDFWLVPARTGSSSSGGIEWPTDLSGAPLAQSPRGIRHRYARLAIVDFNGAIFTAFRADCRRRLPPLTGLLADDVVYNVGSLCQTQLGLGSTATVAATFQAICARLSTLAVPNADDVGYTNTGACATLLTLPPNPSVADALLALCGAVTAHQNNTSNPHATTAAQVGALATSGGTLTGNLTVNGTLSTGGNITSGGRVFDQKIRAAAAFTNNVSITNTTTTATFANIGTGANVTQLSVTVPGSASTFFLVRFFMAAASVGSTSASLLDLRAEFRLLVDTTPFAASQRIYRINNTSPVTWETHAVSFESVVSLSPGAHTIVAQWAATSAQASATVIVILNGSNRELVAIEL